MASMGRKIFWLLTTLGLAGLVWWWVEQREPRGFSPAPRPAAAEPPVPPEEQKPRRCIAVTRSGERCSREAQPGSDLCWQHAG